MSAITAFSVGVALFSGGQRQTETILLWRQRAGFGRSWTGALRRPVRAGGSTERKYLLNSEQDQKRAAGNRHKRGRLLPGAGHKRRDIDRPVLFWAEGSYAIIDRAFADSIEITAILHGSRDIPAILRGRDPEE